MADDEFELSVRDEAKERDEEHAENERGAQHRHRPRARASVHSNAFTPDSLLAISNEITTGPLLAAFRPHSHAMKLLLVLGITLTPALVILPAPRAARDHQKASVDGAGRTRASIMQEEGNLSFEEQQEFLRYMTRGGECIQNGELGLGLGFFKKALALNPTGEKTKVMVERLESKGIAAEYEDGTVDVKATSD